MKCPQSQTLSESLEVTRDRVAQTQHKRQLSRSHLLIEAGFLCSGCDGDPLRKFLIYIRTRLC